MTTRMLYTISIEVELKAPWLVHGNDPGRFGLDATQMRDHEGRLILPGTLVAGRIGAAWDEMRQEFGLSDLPDRKDWLGQEGNLPDGRSRLFIDDLIADEDAEKTAGISPRVPIGNNTGAAANGMLLMMEQTAAPGDTILFRGTWRASLGSSESTDLKDALSAGLLWQSQLGAQRSVGFGKLVDARVTLKPVRAKELTIPAGIPERARLRLGFNTPICVGAHSRRGNVFVSSDVISGGTLKATLARRMADRHGQSVQALKNSQVLARHFDAIRVTHAFPANCKKRPCPLPQSLVAVNDKILDVAGWRESGLIDNQAPAFHHDWKGEIWETANQHQCWGATRRHLRVRAAIDSNTRKAANGKLFAYECVVAEAETRWLADISIAAVPQNDHAAVWQAITELLAEGLGPIGKTDAWAEASLDATCPAVWQEAANLAPRRNDTVVLQLNTPALLLASGQIANIEQPDLNSLYGRIFYELSGGALLLSHFYASHDMAGGGYLQARFSREGATYRPYVLTNAGSVFVLTVNAEDMATGVLNDWRRNGLRLPKAVVDERGDTWEKNPYLPQNGYGEIAVNLAHGFEQAKIPPGSTA